MMIQLATLLAIAIAAGAQAGCGGGGEHAQPDGPAPTDSPSADAPVADGLSRCDVEAAPRAVLVSIGAASEVDLYAMHPSRLVATGVRLTGLPGAPQQIVMRDDGAEALVIYGGFGSPFGVVAITIAADLSAAQIEQTLPIGSDSTPISIAYADHDHAVIALAAAQDEIIAISRGSAGFVAGTRVPAPADYPLAVAARPGSQDVLLSRSQVGVDQAMDVYRLRSTSDGTWHSAGTHASVAAQPIAMALHPSGGALYSPTGDPAHPVTSSTLDAPGMLHAVKIGTDTFEDGGTVALARVATLLAVDPGGRFVVTDGDDFVLDGNGNPNVTGYAWQTVRVGADGSLGQVYPATPTTPGLLFDDLAIAPSGHLIAMRELYAGSVPVSLQYPLELWAQPSWGTWQLCDTAYLSGGARVAIAPATATH